VFFLKVWLGLAVAIYLIVIAVDLKKFLVELRSKDYQSFLEPVGAVVGVSFCLALAVAGAAFCYHQIAH
jgi:hypothetical protein